jgi:hypothetical protein
MCDVLFESQQKLHWNRRHISVVYAVFLINGGCFYLVTNVKVVHEGREEKIYS